MADQVFDLTQTGQQVQDIINDADKVKDAGAQTTLTTEFVLLKDVNGNYHKILKSFFTEAIRDTLAGLLVNNDKGTTINQIAAIASGDFGSITPANLTSVLGGVKVYDNAITDCNDRLNITGIAVDFFSSVEPTNMPPSATSHYSIMLTVGKYKSSYPHAFQLWIDHKAYAAYRIHYDNNANKSWKTISTE